MCCAQPWFGTVQFKARQSMTSLMKLPPESDRHTLASLTEIFPLPVLFKSEELRTEVIHRGRHSNTKSYTRVALSEEENTPKSKSRVTVRHRNILLVSSDDIHFYQHSSSRQ